MFRAKLDVDSVHISILEINHLLCKPSLPEDEVRRLVDSAAKKHKAPTHSQAAMELALKSCELWHSPDGTAYATISRNGHKEHWKVCSVAYTQWLSRAYYEAEVAVIGSQTVQDVLNTLEGKACFDGEEHPVYLRVVGDDEHIFIDLCNDSWQAVEIDADGWRVVDNPPVRFRRTKEMLPLLLPVPGGTAADSRSALHRLVRRDPGVAAS